MEGKTKVRAEEGQQEIWITRDFDLPVEALFKAYTTPGIVEQWMGTRVLKMENTPSGAYLFETTDPQGNKFRFRGVIHEYAANGKITRTFEFENMPMGVQLEFLSFESLAPATSRLTIQSIYRSVTQRDQQLKMPFAWGLNMAHNKLQEVMNIQSK